jgi:hypothetical protein
LIVSCPGAALVGLSAAPLWTSKASYLTDTGSVYASEKNLDKNAIINRFFGIFFTFFQSCLLFLSFIYTLYYCFVLSSYHYTGQIWGNMISYLVLTPENKAPAIINGTENNTMLIFKRYDKCGADFSEEEYQSSEIVNKIDRRTV